MMSWEFTFLAIIIGMLFFIILFIVYSIIKVKKVAKDLGIQKEDIAGGFNELRDGFKSNEPKQLNGMTSLLEPQIVKDFSSFSKEMLYNKTEESLRAIFNALSYKDKSRLDKIPLIRGVIENAIDDYEKNNINISFSDVNFHKFALAKYEKRYGVASITVETSLEYIYTKEQNGKKIIGSNSKFQTAYSCVFVYIYDESVIDEEYFNKVIGLNCPNCGAPIRSFKQESCSFCHTALHIPYKDFNNKGWELASYKEK